MRVRDYKVSEHFYRSEVQCRHCAKVGPYRAHFERTRTGMERVRNLARRPVVVTSWYRCVVHNRAVGGVPNSAHLACLAVDYYIPGLTIHQAAELARAAGFDKVLEEPLNSKRKTWVHAEMSRA